MKCNELLRYGISFGGCNAHFCEVSALFIKKQAFLNVNETDQQHTVRFWRAVVYIYVSGVFGERGLL